MRAIGTTVTAALLAAFGLAAAASAKPTASVVAARAAAGTTPGAMLDVTPRIRVAGGRGRVALSVVLTGPRTYALKAAKPVALTGTRSVPFAVKVPKNAKLGAYRLTVCVSPARQHRGCLAAKSKVLIASFTRKGKALTAPRTLDAERATTRTLGPAGGTLTTTAADGATATLTIPKDALLLDTEITMTPVTAIGGHPANPSVAAGVDLQPHGIALGVPATLELKPSVKTQPVQRTLLTSDADGANTRPELFKDAGDGAKVRLFHFSSYELTYIPAGNRAAQRAIRDWKLYPPGPDLEQMTSELAESIGAERIRQLSGSDDAASAAKLADLTAGTIAAYYSGQVVPLLLQAKGECQIAPLALESARGWQRFVELLGLNKRFAAELDRVQRLVEEVYVATLSCLHKRCVVDGFPEAYADYLQVLRQVRFIGVDPPYDVYEEARRCLRFRFEIDSTNIGAAGVSALGAQRSGPGYVYHVTGEVTFSVLAEPRPLVPLRYASFTGNQTDFYPGTILGCTDLRITSTAAGGVDGAMTVQPMVPTLLNRSTLFEQQFRLVVDLGDTYDAPSTTQSPYEKINDTVTKGGGSCSTDPDQVLENRWARVFDYVSTTESKVRTPKTIRPYTLAGFTRGVRPVFLTRTTRDTGDLGGNLFDITTTMRLVHVPLKDSES